MQDRDIWDYDLDVSDHIVALTFLSLPIIFFGLLLALCIGTPGNLDFVKAHAAETWEANGFTIRGYEGYNWSFGGYNEYGGARVRYQLRKTPDNGVTYTGSLQRWGNEIHVVRVRAQDAVSPK